MRFPTYAIIGTFKDREWGEKQAPVATLTPRSPVDCRCDYGGDGGGDGGGAHIFHGHQNHNQSPNRYRRFPYRSRQISLVCGIFSIYLTFAFQHLRCQRRRQST